MGPWPANHSSEKETSQEFNIAFPQCSLGVLRQQRHCGGAAREQGWGEEIWPASCFFSTDYLKIGFHTLLYFDVQISFPSAAAVWLGVALFNGRRPGSAILSRNFHKCKYFINVLLDSQDGFEEGCVDPLRY